MVGVGVRGGLEEWSGWRAVGALYIYTHIHIV